jgi:HD superfamily phosphohydrolase/DNA-binding transcriptional ArsR family regulator
LHETDIAKNRIRDPLYGDILLTDRELEIVKSPDFQRLNYVLQLPTVYKVYPGATHTRYSHSLGVLHVAANISREIGISGEDLEQLRIACLLHDIAELPFERIFEEYLTFNDDEFRRTIIRKICEDIDYDWNSVWNILDGKRAEKTGVKRLYQILYSDVGANKIDYLRRDSFYSGVSYSFIDDRIYSSFVMNEPADEILIKWTYLPVVESLFTGDYQLKHSVYDHKMVRSSLSLVRKSVYAYLENHGKRLEKLLVNERSHRGPQWLLKTDSELLTELKKESPKMIRDFENGGLPRSVYELDFYGLKNEYRDPDILRWFESLRHSAKQIDREIQDKCSFSAEPSFDVVSVVSLSKGLRSPRVLMEADPRRGPKASLWQVSRMLSQWFDYFSEQWKLYVFSSEMSIKDISKARQTCGGIFDFLSSHDTSSLPDPKFELQVMSDLYDIVKRRLEDLNASKQLREKTLTFRDRIIGLSNERREVLRLICEKRQATASEIAMIRDTKRETSTVLLRKLEKDGLVLKKKIAKKVYYVPRNEVEAALQQLSSAPEK